LILGALLIRAFLIELHLRALEIGFDRAHFFFRGFARAHRRLVCRNQ